MVLEDVELESEEEDEEDEEDKSDEDVEVVFCTEYLDDSTWVAERELLVDAWGLREQVR